MKTSIEPPESKVPKNSNVLGFSIVSASDMEIAKSCAAMAAVRGSVGDSEYVYECAPPEVMLEQRKIVRWAVVERTL